MMIRFSWTRLLPCWNNSNIDAVCCEQLEELIEQLRSSTFDVLLTDIQMPAINGFDLVKLLRASNIPQARNIPVIAVTARAEMDEKAFCMNMALPDACTNLFTVKELLVTLNEGQMSADEGAYNTWYAIDCRCAAWRYFCIQLFCTDCLSRKMIRKRRVLLSGLLSKRPARMPTGCNRH